MLFVRLHARVHELAFMTMMTDDFYDDKIRWVNAVPLQMHYIRDPR